MNALSFTFPDLEISHLFFILVLSFFCFRVQSFFVLNNLVNTLDYHNDIAYET